MVLVRQEQFPPSRIVPKTQNNLAQANTILDRFKCLVLSVQQLGRFQYWQVLPKNWFKRSVELNNSNKLEISLLAY
jgi:hypothetical protein